MKKKISQGDIVHIIKMDDSNGFDKNAAMYAGKTGTVRYIDSMGYLHGTWGGLALIPEVDEYEVIGHDN